MSNHERRKSRKLDVVIAILSVIIAGIATAVIVGGGTFSLDLIGYVI